MFTIGEVADKLKVHPQTVYRWIYKGKLEARKIDGILRIDEGAYYNFIGTKFKLKKKKRNVQRKEGGDAT